MNFYKHLDAIAGEYGIKDIDEGIAKAKESIGKRWAKNKLEHLIEVTNPF